MAKSRSARLLARAGVGIDALKQSGTVNIGCEATYPPFSFLQGGAIVGYDVKDRFETLVNAQDFSARVSFKEIKEGKKHVAQAALFNLAENNLKNYPPHHEGLTTGDVLELICLWRTEILRTDYTTNPLGNRPPPQLEPPTAP